MNDISTEWAENVILADADYVDSVAFNLTVNFERMLGRRVPPADMALWAECVAIDGGLEILRDYENRLEGDGNLVPPHPRTPAPPKTNVVLVHEREHTAMKNFVPGNYSEELDGKAVQSRVGELVFNAVQTEDIAPKEQLMKDLLQMICEQPASVVGHASKHAGSVKRLMVVADDAMVGALRPILQRLDSDERRTTLLIMQPVQGGAFRHVLLGYSLMAALGISSREIDEKLKNKYFKFRTL